MTIYRLTCPLLTEWCEPLTDFHYSAMKGFVLRNDNSYRSCAIGRWRSVRYGCSPPSSCKFFEICTTMCIHVKTVSITDDKYYHHLHGQSSTKRGILKISKRTGNTALYEMQFNQSISFNSIYSIYAINLFYLIQSICYDLNFYPFFIFWKKVAVFRLFFL